jgi:hypothetical protein
MNEEMIKRSGLKKPFMTGSRISYPKNGSRE